MYISCSVNSLTFTQYSDTRQCKNITTRTCQLFVQYCHW